jgi:phage terminase large subunit-like protein
MPDEENNESLEICRSWSPKGLTNFYNWLYKAAGLSFTLPDHLYPLVLGLCDCRISHLMEIVGPGSGKALDPQTPVLTDKGWVLLSSIQVGDKVVTPDGKTLSTVRAVIVNDKMPLYRITFADGRQVTANGEHLWKVHMKKFAGRRRVPMLWRIRTTEEIARHLWHCRATKWYVPLANLVEQPEAVLPIDPYVLGAILGDGSIQAGGFVDMTSFDEDIVNRLRQSCIVTAHKEKARYGLSGLSKTICALGLGGTKSWNKFIPAVYKQGSVAQRQALIQGLMDTDGFVGKSGTVTYTSVSRQLAEDVREIIWSLGGIAKITSKKAYYMRNGGKVMCRTAFNVNVRHPDAGTLFYLARKKERAAQKTQYCDNLKLEIDDIEKIADGESICINIDHPDGLFLCGDYIVTHNSVALSQVFPTYLLGYDPTQNIICVSGAENLAQGFQNVVQEFIESNEAFKKVFPQVRPDKGRGWSTNLGAFVTGHRPVPDASYWAAGVSSKAITGKHGTLLIFDDVHNEENSRTEDQCEALASTSVSQRSGRADPMGARYLLAGRRWHQKDLYGRLKDNGDWVVLTLPAERPGSELLWYDISVPEGLECVFTDGMCQTPDGDMVMVIPQSLESRIVGSERKESGVVLRQIKWPYGTDPTKQGFYWPTSKQKRSEYFSNKRMKPEETEATYQCNPGTRQGVVFVDSDFERRFELPPGADAGVLSPQMRHFVGTGAMVIQAWDTAFSANASSDYSVCATLLLVPCEEYHRGENPALLGPCDVHFDISVLDIWRDRVSFAGVVQQMRELYQRWQPYLVVIEKKAYAVAAIEALESAGSMPIEAVMPGSLEGKRSRAVEGVGAGSVQGWARQWRIRLPFDAPWVEGLVRELKDFTGARGNTDDQVDALVHGVRWAIINGGAAASLPVGWNTPDQATNSMLGSGSGDVRSPYDNLMAGIQATDIVDVFGGCCGRCRSFVKNIKASGLPSNRDLGQLPLEYCMLHDKRVAAIGSCDDFADSNDTGGGHPFFVRNI